MPSEAPNARRAWTNDDIARLKALVAQEADPGVAAERLGRSRAAVLAKLAALGLRPKRDTRSGS